MKKIHILVATFIITVFCIGTWLYVFGAEPEWIQYNERVVGENSPLYDDVVNRPMKQIWGNFTTEHTGDGAHKTSYTTSSTFEVEHNPDGTHQPIDTLANPYTLNTLQFRDNSGEFEISKDSGSSWGPVGEVTGGYIEVTANHAVTSSEVSGHLFYCVSGSGTWELSLPDVSTLPDNARFSVALVDVSCDVAILPYTSDKITFYNMTLADGAGIIDDSTIATVTLKKYPDGWIAVSYTGTWESYSGS
jgi:hypothetical protein